MDESGFQVDDVQDIISWMENTYGKEIAHRELKQLMEKEMTQEQPNPISVSELAGEVFPKEMADAMTSPAAGAKQEEYMAIMKKMIHGAKAKKERNKIDAKADKAAKDKSKARAKAKAKKKAQKRNR